MTKHKQALETWVKLNRAKESLSKVRQNELRSIDISQEQSGILRFLWTCDHKPTPAEISRGLYKDRTSITIILKKMESKGLITKNKDVYKKNILRISITEKGKQKYRQIIRKTRIYEILSCLSIEQLSELATLLDIISFKANAELEYKI